MSNTRFRAEVTDRLDLGKAHTFKVTLNLNGATTVVTVKTLAENKARVKLTLKMSGAVNTGIEYSPAVVSWTWRGMSDHTEARPEFRVLQYKGKQEIADVTERFNFRTYMSNKYRILLKKDMTLESGYTYYLVGELRDGEDSELLAAAKVRLPVKWPKKPPKITTSLKISGAVDLIRPDSAVTITASPVKNLYRFDGFSQNISSEMIKVSTDKAGTNVLPRDEVPFYIWQTDRTPDSSTVYRVIVKENFRDELLPTAQYYVFVDGQIFDQEVTSKPVQLKLKKSAPKLSLTTKSVQMLKNDRFSYADIGITVPAGYAKIKEVTLDAKSAASFTLTDNSGGRLELHFKENVVPPAKATVKLNVFLEGNNTGKPDKVLTVSGKVV